MDKSKFINETIKEFSDSNEFKRVTEAIYNNILDINQIDNSKSNEDNTNLLNMYLLDENGNNVCDILNKINNNLSKILIKLDKD
tara:strand:+ start:3855 stop:4106 length:252 start_codon:yes stop_codon:yes gene_type:complete